jgi:ADP-ribose pyrophosphatase
MNRQIFDIKKITHNKWLNLFSIKVQNSKGCISDWIFASRKDNPIKDTSTDAVIIVPIINTLEGKKLIVIKEYRWAINDFEYGFPAGLIEPNASVIDTVIKELKEETGLNIISITDSSYPVYSSPGLSDESCTIIFVQAEGEITKQYQEVGEDIEVLEMGVNDLFNLIRDPTKKVGAKAWGIFYYYTKIGRIE